ncbi:MAG: outer membrane protein assembly factor BamE [Burkholderiaceae bacterium]|nr:outer membrane protein assembly factor BamE [Burkholderiaceae bacterium]
MNNPVNLATLSLALVLAGCAGLGGAPLMPGEPEGAVRAKLGNPSAVHAAGGEKVLEYATGPAGQQTYMARIGADGALKSFEQVLTDEKFATIKIGAATRHDVLLTLGRPAETSYLSRQRLEVWSYRYKQAGVWDAMMHVHFDRDGIVRLMQNGPDRDKERERDFFGFFR